MDTMAIIKNRYNSLTKTEKQVADYIERNPADVILLSLQMLAQHCNTSDATVLRFCRSLGFSGYQDFKSTLIPELLKNGVPINKKIDTSKDHESIKADLIYNLNEELNSTISNLCEQSLLNVVEAMDQAKIIYIIGLAGSAGVARIMADSLLSFKKPAYYFSDRVEIERIASLISTDDLLFAISHSGENEEVCMAVKRANSNNVFTVGLTNFAPSKLHSLAEITLLTSISESLLGSYSYVPRIAQLAILELITLFIEKLDR